MTPKVSVIVPVYNVQWNLDKCIQSLISQTYTNIEIILINDGSKDESLNICLKYANIDKRIIVIDKPNTGVSDTRNIGIQSANGEYIVFVDSDDWVEKTYIEDFKIQDLGGNRSIVVVQGIVYDYPRRNKHQHHIMFQYPNINIVIPDNLIEIKKYSLLENGCPVAKLFSTKVIRDNNLKFNTNLSLNEDHLFILDYYQCINEIKLICEINYHYFFDYQIPSLTKIKHSSSEYIEIAKEILGSYRKLSRRFGLDENFLCEFSFLFGPSQLIKASKSSFSENGGFKRFCFIVKMWKLLGISEECNKDVNYYIYLFYKSINGESKYFYYVVLFILSRYENFIYRLKYVIKKYVLKG